MCSLDVDSRGFEKFDSGKSQRGVEVIDVAICLSLAKRVERRHVGLV
jgi:hypothetical protein